MLIHCWYLQTDTFQTKLLFQTFETKYLLNKSMGCHVESGQHHKESEILWTTDTKILLMMLLVSYDRVTGYWPVIGQWWWSTIVYLLMITRTEQWVMSMARLGPDIIIWRQAPAESSNLTILLLEQEYDQLLLSAVLEWFYLKLLFSDPCLLLSHLSRHWVNLTEMRSLV